jgi:hypothetical protein
VEKWGLWLLSCAQSVLMTDLPSVLPLLQSNMDRNRHLITNDSTHDVISMECCECDWYQQPLNSGIMDFSVNVDCVWVQELVKPLLNALHIQVTTSSSSSGSTLKRDAGEDTNGGDGNDDSDDVRQPLDSINPKSCSYFRVDDRLLRARLEKTS